MSGTSRAMRASVTHLLSNLSSIPAKLPMYCGPAARDKYTGDANFDFTHRARDAWQLLTGGTFGEMMDLYWNSRKEYTVDMYDAREFEKASGLSKQDFFAKHGFCILDHKSAMTAQDWVESAYVPLQAHDSEKGTAEAEFTEGESPVSRIYNNEIMSLIKNLLPSASDITSPVRGILRGPGGAYEKIYASVIHTDFPVDYDMFCTTNSWLGLKKQIQKFEASDEVNALIVTNFWRPVLPMKAPLTNTPLALLHPDTVEYDDFVTVDLNGGQMPEGQTYLHLRYKPRHRWLYYSNMTTDEVIVWRQAHFVKGEKLSRMPIAHTAFKHPSAQDTAEPRTSFEHRITVLERTSD